MAIIVDGRRHGRWDRMEIVVTPDAAIIHV
jgi:hypothetical protein